MSKPHTLVSGGTGYVGRFIVEDLLDAGHSVSVAGRTAPPAGLFSKPIAFRPLSLEPQSISTALFEGVDFFVHGAFDHLPGKYRGGEGDDAEGFTRRNREGSIALFEAAKSSGVRRCVFLSSRAVYGPYPAGRLLDEADEAGPDTLYGRVKLAGEKALSALCDDGFAGTSLRVTGVYGAARPGQSHKWEALFEDYRQGRTIEPRAGTEVHGRDVGAAARLMLEAKAEDVTGRVFNVSDMLIDRRDILAIYAGLIGCENALPEAVEKAAINAMRTGRLCALGWQPGGRALLEETISRLLI